MRDASSPYLLRSLRSLRAPPLWGSACGPGNRTLASVRSGSVTRSQLGARRIRLEARVGLVALVVRVTAMLVEHRDSVQTPQAAPLAVPAPQQAPPPAALPTLRTRWNLCDIRYELRVLAALYAYPL